jgi:5-formyltetrahydrofolate cyclo-ligase
VTELDAFVRSDVVLTYLSVGSEVDTRAIVTAAWEQGKTVAIPRCVAGERRIAWHRISSFDGLERSAFGIEEPKDDPQTRICLDDDAHMVVLVPGIAFDMQGLRLGYGGGYYDVFLSTFGGATIGLCREGQLVWDLRALGVIEPHDMQVKIVVSENGVRKEG